ncbi:hypothetical protein [Streptomyces zhihengii]
MTSWDFAPTHVVPRAGLPAWEGPDTSRPTVPLDPLLPVQLLERRGDWAQVLCVNGWSAWVDGRLLVSVPADPPAAGQPAARTADPRPLLARAEEALGRYRRAAGELADGSLDGETFRLRTRGLKVGMVVDGESVWLYDAEHERWVHCDGRRLATLAASAEPAVQPGRAPAAPAAPGAAGPADPTRVTGADPPRPPDGPRPAAVADPPPPTQVVPDREAPTPDTDAPPPTRVVPDREAPTPDTDAPPPTRVVPDREAPTPDTDVPPPTQVVDGRGGPVRQGED